MDATLNLSKLAKPFNDETATRELLESMTWYEEADEQPPEAQKRTLKKYAKVGGKKQTA